MNLRADVLVVDDTPAHLKLLTGMLEECGHSVRAVTNGHQALDAARREVPELILLDLDMPGVDGVEVCQRLREDEALACVPIIFISPAPNLRCNVECFACGGAEHLTLPCQLGEVRARVTALLRQRQLQRELRAARSRLRQFDGFLRTLVHDMASPIMVITNLLELLDEDFGEHLPDESRQDIEQIISSSEELLGMLNELRDVNRLELGEMPMRYVECDLTAEVAQVVRALNGAARGRRIELDAAGVITTRADRELLRRTIRNLLLNALAHTPPSGRVGVRVSLRGGRGRVEVRDEGGIPEEYRGQIFEKLSLASARREGKYHSVGLGLAFCKLAIDAHGGELGVEHQPRGEGSTFWFELPTVMG